MTGVPGGWAAEVGRDGAVILGANAGCAEKAWSGTMEQMDNIHTKQVHIGITHAISYGREQDSGQVK